jgi:hypothetical protein
MRVVLQDGPALVVFWVLFRIEEIAVAATLRECPFGFLHIVEISLIIPQIGGLLLAPLWGLIGGPHLIGGFVRVVFLRIWSKWLDAWSQSICLEPFLIKSEVTHHQLLLLGGTSDVFLPPGLDWFPT